MDGEADMTTLVVVMSCV